MSDPLNYMRIDAPEGTKVRWAFHEAGYPNDQVHAAKHLKFSNTYTVDETVIHTWSTDVYLKEVPGVAFNSVIFAEVV